MGIYNTNGKGHYPYSFQVEPYYNGAPITSQNQVVLSPRFSNVTTADNFSYSADADYSPAGCYADLTLPFAAMSGWYNEWSGHGGPSNQLNHPGSTGSWSDAARPFFQRWDGSNMTARFSLWMMFHVGHNPHPGSGVAETYFSMLCNSNGSWGGGAFYNFSGPSTGAYDNPREYFDGSRKIRISGDNYGNGNYRGWACVANQQTASGYMNGINATTLRIINIGRQTSSATADLRIAGVRVIYHVMPGAGTTYGNLDV
jgi:hypothetical protein